STGMGKAHMALFDEARRPLSRLEQPREPKPFVDTLRPRLGRPCFGQTGQRPFVMASLRMASLAKGLVGSMGFSTGFGLCGRGRWPTSGGARSAEPPDLWG